MEGRGEALESEEDVQSCKCTESKAVQTSSYTPFSIESILGLKSGGCKTNQQHGSPSAAVPVAAAARPCNSGNCSSGVEDKSAVVYPALLAECSTSTGSTAQPTVIASAGELTDRINSIYIYC